MITKEFVRKYFLHKYKCTIRNNIRYYEVVNTESDFNDAETTITKEQDFLEVEDKYFIIWCEHGHLIKASLDTMEDLIENGCPFCKSKEKYDWQRHIDYSVEFDSYGYVAESLKGYRKYKHSIINVIKNDSHLMVNSNQLNINKLPRDVEIVDAVRYCENSKSYIINHIQSLGADIWDDSTMFGKVQAKNLIPLHNNCLHVYENYKAAENDIFVIICNECHKRIISSALKINYEGLECCDCGKKLWEKHNWFNYDYERYFDDKEKGIWTNEYIFINPKYGTKLQDLKPYLNENYINPAEIDCSLLEWCQREENQDIGNIVINQFAKVKNRKKLCEIRADSEEVLWLRSSKGSLFDTTVKSIVRDRKLREKLPSGTSFAELFVYYALKKCYSEVIHRYRTNENIEFDIYIPEIKQCIEYNGYIYHKVKYDKTENDLAKQQYCIEHGMKLLVIEDDSEEDSAQIIDNKIIFKDSQRNRCERLYEVCQMVAIYLFTETELPSIKEIMRNIKLYY